jgi:plastin-3
MDFYEMCFIFFSCPGLANLLKDDEKIEDLMRLQPEAILLRWVNYHMERAGVTRRCNNFSGDIQDSEIYAHLLSQIAPKDLGVSTVALMVCPNHHHHLVYDFSFMN